jgi:hypothetical protein
MGNALADDVAATWQTTWQPRGKRHGSHMADDMTATWQMMWSKTKWPNSILIIIPQTTPKYNNRATQFNNNS